MALPETSPARRVFRRMPLCRRKSGPRKSGSVAGLDVAQAAFHHIDDTIAIIRERQDGETVERGQTIMQVRGQARAILMAERVALNFLCHMSGIATATAALVQQTKGTQTRIACTRKTTPGLRVFEKFAVRCGGGVNHRFGLYDAVMIKDNHIAACGSISAALTAARQSVGHTVKIEIEIDHIDQLEEALLGNADIILLDNMSTDELSTAVKMTQGRAILEASGNVTVERVAAIAATGVDIISSGWITHSAPVLDLGLDVIE